MRTCSQCGGGGGGRGFFPWYHQEFCLPCVAAFKGQFPAPPPATAADTAAAQAVLVQVARWGSE